MKYKIEHGIPIPGGRGQSEFNDLMVKLNVGDSFVAPRNKRSVIVNVAWRLNIKVLTRKVDDENMRVWRVEPAETKTETVRRAVIAAK